MSYDLIGVRIAPGESVETVVERLEELELIAKPPDDDAWDRMLEIAAALEAIDPTAERWEDRDAGLIELTAGRVQVWVCEHSGGISMPYGSDSDDADLLSAQGLPYVAALSRVGDFRIYDPQTGSAIDPDEEEGPSAIASGYAASNARVRAALKRSGGDKRWWQVSRRLG